MLGKSTINDGELALTLLMTTINNGGLVKTFKASFDKPVLGGLFQCFQVHFWDLGFLFAYLNSETLLCKII